MEAPMTSRDPFLCLAYDYVTSLQAERRRRAAEERMAARCRARRHDSVAARRGALPATLISLLAILVSLLISLLGRVRRRLTRSAAHGADWQDGAGLSH
jgi:hypothetical protein